MTLAEISAVLDMLAVAASNLQVRSSPAQDAHTRLCMAIDEARRECTRIADAEAFWAVDAQVDAYQQRNDRERK